MYNTRSRYTLVSIDRRISGLRIIRSPLAFTVEIPAASPIYINKSTYVIIRDDERALQGSGSSSG